MSNSITLSNGVVCTYSRTGLTFSNKSLNLPHDGNKSEIELKISHVHLDDEHLFDYEDNSPDSFYLCSGDGVIAYHDVANKGITIQSLNISSGELLISSIDFTVFRAWFDKILESLEIERS